MKEVFIVDAKRTPQVKSGGEIKDLPVPYLASGLVRHILDKTEIPNDEVEEVIIGNVGAPAKYPNISRVVALEAGLDKKTSAYSVHRNCASGMEAVSQAFDKISSGRNHVILAGGLESMSQMPLLYGKEMTEFFVNLMKAKSVGDKLKVASSFRLPHLSPIIAIEQGLTDPFCGMNMGQTAEVLAREFSITREQQDEFAIESHNRVVEARKQGLWADEIVPLHYGKNVDNILYDDIGPREGLTLEKMAKLRPYFDKKSGSVTVGNACPITDGGSMLLFCSREALDKYNLKPMARLVDYHFHGLEPERMGMGPLLAMNGVLDRVKMKLADMDYIEINEAFAAQVLSVKKACEDKSFSSRWGIDDALGEIDPSKLNPNGGGIALGHPVGSSGSRIMVTLSHQMKRQKSKYGIASLCIGGGQGGAVVIENLMN